MPRLPKLAYLQQSMVLRNVWTNDPWIFGYLSMADQRALHDFFLPSRELAEAELLAHRRLVTRQQPPHRAGKAINRLHMLSHPDGQCPHLPARKSTSPRRKRQPQVVIRPVLRPEPDTKKLGMAVWRIARKIGEEESGKTSDQQQPGDD